MSKVHPEITPELREFIEAQKLFFVATAPLAADGHVNLSPKGHDSLRVLDPLTLAYLDLTGSAAETLAHLKENGRICLLFCSFEGAPQIVRVHGEGEAIERSHPEFAELADLFPDHPGARAVIRVRAKRVADSCGFSVPLYEYQGERSLLIDWAKKRGPDGLDTYRAERNASSIDGLPAVEKK